jgi:hypothetical protein
VRLPLDEDTQLDEEIQAAVDINASAITTPFAHEWYTVATIPQVVIADLARLLRER